MSQRVFITGSNSGIGYETSRILLRKGYTIYVGCRTLEKMKDTRNRLIEAQGKEYEDKVILLCPIDLSSLTSILHFIQFMKEGDFPLDILVNNAGVMPMLPASKEYTVDGIEKALAVNYVGHCLLTIGLLPLLLQSPTKKVIHLASLTHRMADIHIDDLNLDEKGKYSHELAYAQSKLAVVMFSNELHRRYRHAGLCSISLCPGIVATNIIRDGFGIIQRIASWLMTMTGKTLEEGAATTLYAIEKVAGEHGGIYLEDERISSPHPRVYDQSLTNELWCQTYSLIEGQITSKETLAAFKACYEALKPYDKEVKIEPYKGGDQSYWIAYWLTYGDLILFFMKWGIVLVLLVGLLLAYFLA